MFTSSACAPVHPSLPPERRAFCVKFGGCDYKPVESWLFFSLCRTTDHVCIRFNSDKKDMYILIYYYYIIYLYNYYIIFWTFSSVGNCTLSSFIPPHLPSLFSYGSVGLKEWCVCAAVPRRTASCLELFLTQRIYWFTWAQVSSDWRLLMRNGTRHAMERKAIKDKTLKRFKSVMFEYDCEVLINLLDDQQWIWSWLQNVFYLLAVVMYYLLFKWKRSLTWLRRIRRNRNTKAGLVYINDFGEINWL